MTNFLIQRAIKGQADIKDEAVRERCGKLSGVVGICCNVLLCLGKMAAGLLFHSISVVADAVNNLSDALSSVVTLVGFHMAGKPADEDHPYGHQRIEYLSGLLVSFLILVIGLQLVKSSVEKIIRPDEVAFSYLTLAVLLASMGVKTWMFLFNRKMGNLINSSVLRATAQDSLNDVVTTGAVLVSAVISRLSGFQLDGYVGVLVSLFIIYSGIGLIKDTLNPLLGEAPSPELVADLEQKIKSYDGVEGLHDLMVHDYGPQRRFASVHVEVSAKRDIMDSHDMIDNIEREIAETMGLHLVIHMDPIIMDDPVANRAHDMVVGVVQGIDHTLSIHDFRMVQGPTHSNLIFDITVPPKCKVSDGELREAIQQAVWTQDKTLHCVITIDRSYISSTERVE